MQFIQVVKAVLFLLPAIMDTIRAIEETMPVPKAGAAKLAVLRETLRAGYELGNNTVVPFEQLWPTVERVAGAVVAAYKQSGVFK